MRLLLTDRTRAGLLAVCIGLIGGTGCITAAVVSNVQQNAVRRENEEKSRKLVEEYRAAAARGDQGATVRLALEYIKGPPGTERRDIPKAVTMLEQEVAKQYGAAEYALGLLLINGRNVAQSWGSAINPDELPRQPERGIDLLKKSATAACGYDYRDKLQGGSWVAPAYVISELYRNGTELNKDEDQADLWIARSIIHCAYPTPSFIDLNVRWAQNAPPTYKMASWLLLMPPSQQRTQSISEIAPEDMEPATSEAARLRRLVAESEHQYPAPPKRIKP